MKARIGFGLLLLVLAFVATAGGNRAAVRKTVENSTLVTGSIDIGTDGAVQGYRIDQKEKFADGVLAFVDAAVRSMRFEPVVVDGKVVNARARMGLRLVAREADNGEYRLRLGSASFGDEKLVEGESVTSRKMTPPSYPPAAYRSNVTGTVYLVVKVDSQGAVQDVAVEQTNLTVLGTERQMEVGRGLLERASMEAARKWAFKVPTRGEEAGKSYWSVRVPVDFLMEDDPDPHASYGSWRAYVPGPRHPVSWLSDEENRQSPEAMLAGTANLVGSGPKLLTPLGEG